jgi:hypothetical protein
MAQSLPKIADEPINDWRATGRKSPSVHYFARALERAAKEHGLPRTALAAIERYWEVGDLDFLIFGWVVAYRDCGRFYLEYLVDDEHEHMERLHVEPLAPDQQRPTRIGLGINWSDDTRFLLEALEGPLGDSYARQ